MKSYILQLLGLLFGLCSVVFYYRVAVFEKRSGILWASASLVLWFLTWWVFDLGILKSLALQILPLVAMTIVKMVRQKRIEDGEGDGD